MIVASTEVAASRIMSPIVVVCLLITISVPTTSISVVTSTSEATMRSRIVGPKMTRMSASTAAMAKPAPAASVIHVDIVSIKKLHLVSRTQCFDEEFFDVSNLTTHLFDGGLVRRIQDVQEEHLIFPIDIDNKRARNE